jgi:hypothetical protein
MAPADGGELLFTLHPVAMTSIAKRERNIKVEHVEVNVEGDFGAEGEPAKNVRYCAKVSAQASEEEIREMMKFTDTVAEIQNTLRNGTSVVLSEIEAVKI